MPVDRIATYSRLMATLTLVFITTMLLANALIWLMPGAWADWGVSELGLSMRLEADNLGVTLNQMPSWQLFGGLLLSSIPLLILARGLYALRTLFQRYAQGDYFSAQTSGQLGKMGWCVVFWALSSFLVEPLLSMWATLLQPPGQRMLTLSVSSSSVVALFLGAAIILIAHILAKASALAEENQQFI